MPELPEVHTVKDTLKKQLLNKEITNIEIIYPNMIESDINEFKSKLIGQAFIDIHRKGKYLIFETENNYLISHLRMEGKFFIKNHLDIIDKHEHVIFEYEDFDLRYHDIRKFGKMELIDKDKINDYFTNLGPDANSDIDVNYFYEKINTKNIPIKTLLLDQSIISGLGNIYVDEVLYLSKINPLEKGKNLSLNDAKDILNNSKEILNSAIKHKGTTIRSYTSSLNVKGEYQNYLLVHTKEGEKCKCGAIIQKEKIGGRSTYYCPKCQVKK